MKGSYFYDSFLSEATAAPTITADERGAVDADADASRFFCKLCHGKSFSKRSAASHFKTKHGISTTATKTWVVVKDSALMEHNNHGLMMLTRALASCSTAVDRDAAGGSGAECPAPAIDSDVGDDDAAARAPDMDADPDEDGVFQGMGDDNADDSQTSVSGGEP